MRYSLRFIFSLCFPVVFALPLSAAEPPPPNILWVVSEDNVYTTVGVYGDPLARTPHVDALATDGIVFDRVYSTAPVCAPARSSIISGRYAASLGTQHMRSQRPMPADAPFLPALLRAAGYFCTNNSKTDYNTSTSFAAAWDENSATAHWRHRPAGRPFFSVFNFEHSHESRQHARQPLITDPAKVRVPDYLPDTPEIRADLAQYYDSVSRADAAIGQILAQLKADGLEKDTIIFYYGDNGGATPRSKYFPYENGTHVPMIVRFPKKYAHLAPSAPGSRVGDLINFVDLAPTVLSLAHAPIPATFQGRAFAGPARAPGPEWTFMSVDRMGGTYDLARAVTDGRYRYIRNYHPDRPWGSYRDYMWRQESVRVWERLYLAGRLTPVQRAFFEPRKAEELFDCATDPDNVHNLAADPAQAGRLARMRDALHAHQRGIRDTGFLPEPMMITLAAGGAPGDYTASAERYPLEKLIAFIDAAELPAAPDPAAVDAALADPHPAMRYWGGIAALRLTTLPAAVVTRLADTDECVRLTAAEAILRREPSDAAWSVIERALAQRPGSDESRLFILNVLARIPRAYPASVQTALNAVIAEESKPTANAFFGPAIERLRHAAALASARAPSAPHQP